MVDPNPRVAGQGLAQLEAAGVTVSSGLLAAQAEALNPGFVMRMRRGRPFIRAKLAMSLDGRTAMASGESKWITGEAARADVQRLRARSAAIITGIGTVLADDPSLNVRLDGQDVRQPLRVVLDPHLSLLPTARLLSLPGRTLVCTAANDAAQREQLERAGAEVVRVQSQGDALDLSDVMELLGREQINEALLETGATLSGAMLRAGLIDELVIYMAPHLMGDTARGLFHLPGLMAMQDRVALEITDIRAVGKDWRITCRVG
jgi:diaminohydroxyphosphoribosylaminopyrimidine deaminase/5-amino-6-(5-phosphoribosylamino)uracil reductase